MPTALLIVDVQRSLVEDETWEPERVLARVGALEAAARTAGAPNFYISDNRVAPHGELHPRLSPRPSDPRLTKANCDSFLATRLQAELEAACITRLVVCGLHTDFCIDTTCRRAASLGYQVTLVADGHSTFERDYLSAAQVIGHHNRILDGFTAATGLISVLTSEQVVFA